MRTYRLLLSIAFLSFSSYVFGQSTSASITGIVEDPSKAVIVNASITAINTETGVSTQAVTNSSGVYTISGLIPGSYRIEVDKQGFKGIIESGLVLHVQDIVQLNFHMAVGSMSENVTVDASGIQINTTDGGVSTVIDQQFIENMPLNGRSLQSLESVIPGVSVASIYNNVSGPGEQGEMSVNGQRTEGNYYTLDGVSATVGSQINQDNIGYGAGYSGSVESQTTLGSTQGMVSVDDLQEFRANTSSYAAEFGRGPGGQFSFTSRSGTNQWHGSAFDYFRNDVLDSNNWFNGDYDGATPTAKQAERQNDFGGTFGGPVRIPHLYNGTDKTFFFFNYEGLRLVSPQPATQYWVPSNELRAAAPQALDWFILAFPEANGTDFGDGLALYTAASSNFSSINQTSERIDHSFGEKIKFFARYNHAPSYSNEPTPGQAITNIVSSNADSITAGATVILSPRVVDEIRYNFTRSFATHSQPFTNFGSGAVNPNLSALPGAPIEFVSILNWDNGAVFPVVQSNNNQHQTNIVDSVNWSVGRHVFKFGVDYRRLANVLGSPYTHYENGQFYSEASVLANKTDYAFSTYFPWKSRPVYNNLSLYAQDQWKVKPRLSLSLGLRWDVNPAPKDAGGHNPVTLNEVTDLDTATLAPANSPLWNTDYAGFAPRAGFAYQLIPTAGRQTVLRGGFGLFFDPGNALGSEGYVGEGFQQEGVFTGSPYPLSASLLSSVPSPNDDTPYTGTIYAFDPHLRMPYSYQWNVAIEQELSSRQSLMLNYVGSNGRNLIENTFYEPIAPAYSEGNGVQVEVNGSSSSYNALQARYQHTLSHGLQALVGYTWSHGIDFASINFEVYELERASSDNDIRNNLQAAITYDVPGKYSNKFATTLLSHWSLDTRMSVVSAMPLDIRTAYTQVEDGIFLRYHPNRVPNQPLTIHGSQYPGHKALNPAAYSTNYDSKGNIIEGNAGRNAAEADGATNFDQALRKDFKFGETVGLQFRAEAFNIFNHPQFGDFYKCICSTGYFGTAYDTRNIYLGGLSSLYQTGGPRSLQLALRLHF